ncbi:cd36 antigen, putative, partial [Ixodes scapularis]
SAAHTVRFDTEEFEFFKEAVSEIFVAKNSTFFVRRTMRELLFDGYDEPILTAAKSLGIEVPSTKFGWLLGKNGTDDGEYTIFTGSKGMHNYGEMDKYNGLRSIRLSYLGDVETRGVKLRRYWGEGRLFDYAEKDNRCFCTGACFPSGVLNISACQQGAPVAVSFPHFLYGDPSYQQAVEGIAPDPKRHQMYLDIEPLASADKGLLSKVRLVTEEIPQYVTVASFGAVIIGGIVLLATLVYAIRYTRRPKPVRPTYIPVTVLK